MAIDASIYGQIRQPELWHPRLPRAENLARTAQFQIFLGNEKPIIASAQNSQAFTTFYTIFFAIE